MHRIYVHMHVHIHTCIHVNMYIDQYADCRPSYKLQVSIAKYRLFYRALLQQKHVYRPVFRLQALDALFDYKTFQKVYTFGWLEFVVLLRYLRVCVHGFRFRVWGLRFGV